MPIHKRIRKILFMTGWITLSVLLLVLLVAAMSIKGDKPCTGVDIVFKGPQGALYVGQDKVARLLDARGLNALSGRPVRRFNLGLMETVLEKDPWIGKAELYFDKNNRLHVEVTEKTPFARVFTLTGETFYIDSALQRIPLNERHSPLLPVFTGVKLSDGRPNRNDSLLLQQVLEIARFLRADPFWMAQIDQVDHNPARGFELVPKVGEHLIVFGEGTEVAEKFHKLAVFYHRVLAEKGWNGYAEIDLRFRDQLVAVPRNRPAASTLTAPTRESLQAWLDPLMSTDSVMQQVP